MKKKLTAIIAMAMSMMMAISFVGCKKDNTDSSSIGNDSGGGTVIEKGEDVDYEGLTIADANLKQASYNTLTSLMPSNWNELTYADNNDTQILNYISSAFFDYDYDFGGVENKYNADGTINADAIVAGSFTTTYSAATKLEDVTSTVDAKWGYTEKEKAEGGYAWKITLRNDLRWDDGTLITANDFVYSMDAQLDPNFMNFRADTYYKTLRVKNARDYFYKNQAIIYNAIGDMDYESNAEALADGVEIYVNVCQFWFDLAGSDISGLVDKDGNVIPQWLKITDETGYDDPDLWGTEYEDPLSAKYIWDTYLNPTNGMYADYAEVGAEYESWLGIPEKNENTAVTFADVGMYAVPGENAFVICLGKSYQFLKEDYTLSYLSAYYMASLPLVKRDLYERCKQEPETGSTLWTTNYNSSLETTASWGPYKLASFQAGKSYQLVKNPYWYGYNMNLYKNQYNITTINCEVVKESQAQWMKFLKGEVDDGNLMEENLDDYLNSKYVTWVPGTGTYGMQVYGNKTVLANSNNNNAILAIDEFRQALSLALSRTDVVEKVWPGSSLACYGVMNNMYYSDVINGIKYRETKEAKEGLLRAYGYTQGEDGLWSLPSDEKLKDMELDEAISTLTGYDLTLAKQLLQSAITTLKTDASYKYDSSQKIKIIYGASTSATKQQERMAYLQDVIDTLCEGSELEDQIELVFDSSAGQQWAEALRAGKTQIFFGAGFGGNPFNPFDIVGAFVNPDDDLNYHQYWDTSKVDMTLTLPEGDYEKAGETLTMSLQNWYFCLNGIAADNNAKYQYNWDAGIAPAKARLTILAALEEVALKKSYSIMLIAEYTGSLLGEKFSYISYDYNTFNSFGGIRYMKVNYTDAEWAAFVAEHNNDLSSIYKATE